MKEPLLNKITKAAILRAVDRQPHAILLTGETGTGLTTIAEYLERLLRKNNSDLVKLIIKPEDKSTITIEQVRELRTVAKHKNTADSNDIRVMVVISSIDDMQQEAQNALLKMLEEPPAGLLFVILCHDQSSMLSTVESRCIKIPVLPVTQDEASDYFKISHTELNKNFAITGGIPGLLVQLVNNSEHPILEDIAAAKLILGSSTYQRLALVDSLYKTNESAKKLITALDKICHAALKNGSQNDKWINNSLMILSAKEKLNAHVQAKLVVDELLISLR